MDNIIFLGNICDLKCPDDPQGRTYRQINAAIKHNIPIGALVELESGARLFVVYHSRDCDQTPLYYLSAEKDDIEQKVAGFRNPTWDGGWDEDALTVISMD